MNKKILIIDDSALMRRVISDIINADDRLTVADTASNGLQAIQLLSEEKTYDMILCDIMMPKMNGYELTKKIREITNIPIIILSAKTLDSEKILGLDLGADDYLTKPFNPLEVVARVKSLLRRCYEFKLDNVEESKKILKVGELVLNEETVSLTKNGEEIQLTPTEFKILALLMSNPGRVYTKVQIYENINGEYFKNDDGALMVHIYRIREKIEADSKNPMYLKTVRGLGYKIEKI